MSDTPPPPLIDPYVEQQPPPMAMAAQQQAYTAHTGHGSAGPVIAVLAVITILGAAAVMIGRLCSGRGIFGRGPRYDFESWVETKCSSCVDGHVDSSPPVTRRRVVEVSNSSRISGEATAETVARVVEETPDQERSEEEEVNSEDQPPQIHVHSRPVHPPFERADHQGQGPS